MLRLVLRLPLRPATPPLAETFAVEAAAAAGAAEVTEGEADGSIEAAAAVDEADEDAGVADGATAAEEAAEHAAPHQPPASHLEWPSQPRPSSRHRHPLRLRPPLCSRNGRECFVSVTFHSSRYKFNLFQISDFRIPFSLQLRMRLN